jgi:hypothetical protein
MMRHNKKVILKRYHVNNIFSLELQKKWIIMCIDS